MLLEILGIGYILMYWSNVKPYALSFLYIGRKKKRKTKEKEKKNNMEKEKKKNIEKERNKKGDKMPQNKVKFNKDQCISVVKWKEIAWVCEKVRNG